MVPDECEAEPVFECAFLVKFDCEPIFLLVRLELFTLLLITRLGSLL